MTKKSLLFGANIVLLIMSVIWAVMDSSMEPKIAVGSFTLTIMILFFKYNNDDLPSSPSKMEQKAGKNSKQYQAGRDIKIDNN